MASKDSTAAAEAADQAAQPLRQAQPARAAGAGERGATVWAGGEDGVSPAAPWSRGKRGVAAGHAMAEPGVGADIATDV